MKSQTKDQKDPQPHRQRGAVRKGLHTFWILLRPNYKKRFMETMEDGGARESIARSYRNLAAYILSGLRNKSAFPETFEELQCAWGVDDSELGPTIRGMRLQSFIFAFFTVLLVIASFNALYAQSLFMACIYLLLSFAMLFMVLVLQWRVHVLKKRHAIPFKHWLMK